MAVLCDEAARTGHESTSAVIGRDGPLSMIAEALADRDSRLVVIAGDHGSGRTTLADAAAQMAHSRGGLTLRAGATPNHDSLPLSALLLMLRTASTGCHPCSAVRLERETQRLARALQEPRGELDERAVAAVTGTLVELARDVDVTLVIDEVESIDGPSLNAVASMLRLAPLDARLTAIVTAPARGECSLLTAVRRDGITDPTRRIELADLDREHADRLAATVTDHMLSDHEREQIWVLGRGHPGWTVELARQMGGVPPTSTWAGGVATRIQRTAPGALDVAETLALDERWPLWLLPGIAYSAGIGADQSARIVDALVEEGWLVADDGGIRFRHPAMRDHLAAIAGPATRRERHRRLVEYLRMCGRDNPSALIAMAPHLEPGLGPGDEAALALLDAADACMTIDVARAQRWYEDARTLLSAAHPAHGCIIGQLIRCHSHSGDIEQAIAFGTAHLTDPRLDARTAFKVIELTAEHGSLGRAMTLLDRLERYTGPSVDATLTRAKLLCEQNRFDEANDLVESVPVDELTSEQEARRLEVLVVLHHRRGNMADRDELLDRIVRVTASVPPEMRSGLLRRAAAHLAWSGAFTGARELLDEAMVAGDLDTLGASTGLGVAIDGLLHFSSGGWDQVLRLADESSAAMPARDRGLLDALALEVCTARGDFAAGSRIYRRIEELATVSLLAETASAHHRFARGDVDHLRQLDERCRRQWSIGRLAGLPFAILRLVEQLNEVGDSESAEIWAGRLDRLASHDSFPLIEACAARVRSITRADTDSARDAQAVCQRLGYHFEAVRSGLELGERSRDSTVLHAAHDELAALGATPLRRRAARALRDLGVAVPRRHQPTSSDLTETERELVRHVCSGLTNRQIAAAMTLRPKTIETYLTRLYAKVGATSRVELIVRAQDAGPALQ